MRTTTPQPLAYLLFLGSLASSPTKAQEPFDWKLLQGQWAESSAHAYACRKDNLHFRFVLSPDRKQVTFKLDRKWQIGTGKEVTEYSAEIREAHGRMLVIRYGPELEGLSDEMRTWELLFIGPGVYRWKATAWPPGTYNTVIGVRCEAP
jgi:hypothetical protein